VTTWGRPAGAGPRFRVSFPDYARIANNITQTRANFKDMKKGYGKAETKVHAAVKEWFDTEGRGSWVGLARSTIEARSNRWGYYRLGFREGPAHRILHARHVLRRSLTSRGAKNFSYMQGKVWRFGSEDPKAAIHDAGGEAGSSRNPLPARRVVPRKQVRAIVAGELRLHVLGPWLKRGGG